MSTTKPKLLTADDLLRLHSEGARGELIRGVLCDKEMPTGQVHSVIVTNVAGWLWTFNRTHKLGSVSSGDPGILLERNPDTVRGPDVAFFSKERVPPESLVSGYSEVAPDLAVEVVSPNDTRRAVHDKALMWRQDGVRLVWVVYPDTRTVEVHAEGQPVTTLGEEDALDGLEVLPGFTCPVSEIFDS